MTIIRNAKLNTGANILAAQDRPDPHSALIAMLGQLRDVTQAIDRLDQATRSFKQTSQA